MAIYSAVSHSLLAELFRLAWHASAAIVDNLRSPYQIVLFLACVAIRYYSRFSGFVIPLSFVGDGTLSVDDLLKHILGDLPVDLVGPVLNSVKKANLPQRDPRRQPMSLDTVLRPEFALTLLEPAFSTLFRAEILPFWLRIPLEIPLTFRCFRALVWAALSYTSLLAESWIRKYVKMMPRLFRNYFEAQLLLPPLQFTLFVEAFDNYISNELPTYLIRLQDMKLVGRDDIREALRPRIATLTEADLMYQTLRYNLVNPKNQVGYHFTHAIQRYLKFAIFSHRWGPQEPSFRAMMEASPEASWMFPQSPGFQKLLKFCEEARRYGCAYAWSDTCCINKESSSELEEAIRSMYRWYHNAEICIAYLGESLSEEDFEYEPWFARGWTLQELLAPRRIRFYGKHWAPIKRGNHLANDKLNFGLMETIEKVTRIPQADLTGFAPSCSRVYEKMIWASKRRTTRIEDRAYCLLGIFDISMPISYGEGSWAFHRLMEVILQRCGESGILAWSGETSPHSLAIPASPASYLEDFRKVKNTLRLTESVGFTLTKDGLDLELFVLNAKMTSVDRRKGKGSRHPWDELRPPLNLADVRFHDIELRPEWTLKRNWLKDSVQVKADERDLRRCSAWAIGIVCSRDDDGHTTLEPGKEYMWMLIGKLRDGRKSAWVRSRTENIPTLKLHIGDKVRGHLDTVHIPHRL